MPRETTERSIPSPDCKQEAQCYEQVVDGRKWPLTEASVSFGLREWIYAHPNTHCKYFFFLLHSSWWNIYVTMHLHFGSSWRYIDQVLCNVEVCLFYFIFYFCCLFQAISYPGLLGGICYLILLLLLHKPWAILLCFRTFRNPLSFDHCTFMFSLPYVKPNHVNFCRYRQRPLMVAVSLWSWAVNNNSKTQHLSTLKGMLTTQLGM